MPNIVFLTDIGKLIEGLACFVACADDFYIRFHLFYFRLRTFNSSLFSYEMRLFDMLKWMVLDIL